jgi:pilus assembly protein CpaF
MKQKNWSLALGPLAALYMDNSVSEIMVDGLERVTVEREGQLTATDLCFETPEALQAVIDAALSLAGIPLKPGQAIADGRLPDDSRLLVVFPPTAIDGPSLVIRKFMVNPMSWEMLFQYGSVNQALYDLFKSAVLSHKNILISGGPGSGKTTLSNRVAELVPPQERIVVVEPAHMMQIDHPQRVYLESGGPNNISMQELIVTASKMRPDWLVIGELTGAEAMTALEVMNRGHAGLATIHATSPVDALTRLETMCLMANIGLGLSEIRLLIASAIQLVFYLEKLPDGKRRILHAVELRGLENDRYVIQPLIRYHEEQDGWEVVESR